MKGCHAQRKQWEDIGAQIQNYNPKMYSTVSSRYASVVPAPSQEMGDLGYTPSSVGQESSTHPARG